MKRNKKCAIAIDAGGTFFKYALIDGGGKIVMDSVGKSEIDSQGDKESVVDAYAKILKHGFSTACERGMEVRGVGISTPGPFNYKNGISLMKHKFPNMYGVCLIEELKKLSSIPDGIPIKFIHDAHAFVLGEFWYGAAREYATVMGITLGTGVGCGILKNNQIFETDDGRAEDQAV